MIHRIEPDPNGSTDDDGKDVADLSIELRHRLLDAKGKVAVAAYFTGGEPGPPDEKEEALAIAGGNIFTDLGRNRIQRSLVESLHEELMMLGWSSEYAFWTELEKLAKKVWDETITDN